MTIFDTIMPKRRGPAPIPSGPTKAPPIAAKIDAARSDLTATDREFALAALASAEDQEGAGEPLAAVQAKRAEILTRITLLEAAHGAAVDSDQAMFRAQRAALYSTQLAAVKKNLKLRDDAARRLASLIADCVAAHADLVKASRAAQRANPFPSAEMSVAFALQPLSRAVQDEFRRVGGVHPAAASAERLAEMHAVPNKDEDGADIIPEVEHRALVLEIARAADAAVAFPGTEPRGVIGHDPSSLTSLVDVIASGNVAVLAELEGRKPVR